MSDITKANIVYVSTSKNSDYVSAVDHEGAVPYMREERFTAETQPATTTSFFNRFYEELKAAGMDSYYDDISIKSVAKRLDHIVEVANEEIAVNYVEGGGPTEYDGVDECAKEGPVLDSDDTYMRLQAAKRLMEATITMMEMVCVAKEIFAHSVSRMDHLHRLEFECLEQLDKASKYLKQITNEMVD